MKEEAGAVFIITLPSVLRPMGSWWPNGTVFPPPLAPVDWDYPSPKCRPSSVLGDRRVRLERHNPWSIATLRQSIARVLLRQLSSCPFCGAHTYNTVVLGSGGILVLIHHVGFRQFEAPVLAAVAQPFQSNL